MKPLAIQRSTENKYNRQLYTGLASYPDLGLLNILLVFLSRKQFIRNKTLKIQQKLPVYPFLVPLPVPHLQKQPLIFNSFLEMFLQFYNTCTYPYTLQRLFLHALKLFWYAITLYVLLWSLHFCSTSHFKILPL